MNGARTIFRRKGYLLTALAAAVLLAASSGTAWAQFEANTLEVTVDAPQTVREGTDGTITVSAEAMVTGQEAAPAMVRVPVTLTLAGVQVGSSSAAELGSDATAGQVEDAVIVFRTYLEIV